MKNKINRLTVEIDSNDYQLSKKLARQVQDLFSGEVGEQLDRILSATGDRHYQIPKLVLDLGELSDFSFEKEFEDKFRTALIREMSAQISSFSFSEAQALVKKEETPIERQAQISADRQMTSIETIYSSSVEYLYENFMRDWVLSGEIPWWNEYRQLNPLNVLENIIQNEKQAVVFFEDVMHQASLSIKKIIALIIKQTQLKTTDNQIIQLEKILTQAEENIKKKPSLTKPDQSPTKTPPPQFIPRNEYVILRDILLSGSLDIRLFADKKMFETWMIERKSKKALFHQVFREIPLKRMFANAVFQLLPLKQLIGEETMTIQKALASVRPYTRTYMADATWLESAFVFYFNNINRTNQASTQIILKKWLEFIAEYTGESPKNIAQKTLREIPVSDTDLMDEFIELEQAFMQQEIAEEAQKKRDALFPAKTDIETSDIIEHHIENAGLILLWPYLRSFFKGMKLFGEKKTISTEENVDKAIHLLQYLVKKTSAQKPDNLALNNLIVGAPVTYRPSYDLELTEEERGAAEYFLGECIKQTNILKKNNPDALRANYLIREGKLYVAQSKWMLEVKPQPYDILLEKKANISLGTAFFPWSKCVIVINWKTS